MARRVMDGGFRRIKAEPVQAVVKTETLLALVGEFQAQQTSEPQDTQEPTEAIEPEPTDTAAPDAAEDAHEAPGPEDEPVEDPAPADEKDYDPIAAVLG